MSFNGRSGLYAANRKLEVTGNNIANAAITGFKFSRAENADVYSATKL
jgi:flagellar hook protein FlgE